MCKKSDVGRHDKQQWQKSECENRGNENGLRKDRDVQPWDDLNLRFDKSDKRWMIQLLDEIQIGKTRVDM